MRGKSGCDAVPDQGVAPPEVPRNVVQFRLTPFDPPIWTGIQIRLKKPTGYDRQRAEGE
jgi:hypothetical protein